MGASQGLRKQGPGYPLVLTNLDMKWIMEIKRSRSKQGEFPPPLAMVSAHWDGQGMRNEGRSCFVTLLVGVAADFSCRAKKKRRK